MKEAEHYIKAKDMIAECVLCPHNCKILSGKTGLCGVRKNIDGLIYAESYGQISSIALDPIEKKPLRRFYPGSAVLSVGSYGCNLKCPNCQNHSISMNKPETERIVPEQLVKYAMDCVNQGNIGIAYTYNEPLISYEYVYDCAVSLRKSGLKNILVTNGYIEPEPFHKLLPFIDAMNIDLKGFTEDFYKELGGSLSPVKETICKASCHIEITTLIIPGKNDSEDEMHAIASWLSAIDKDIPLHITRFFPRYKMTGLPPTDEETIYKLRDVALQHLKYVYAGNL